MSLPRDIPIAVCVRLDLEYLWIDSLCIIQGSTLDWQAESPRMGNIFSNAFVVPAARGRALDLDREPVHQAYDTVEHEKNPVPSPPVYVRFKTNHDSFFNPTNNKEQ